MKKFLLLTVFFLTACGPSQEEKENIAAVTCSIMSETNNMDGAKRVREINAAREKIGASPYLDGDETIKNAMSLGVCKELVLNDPKYFETIKLWERETARELAESEKKRLAQEERERLPRANWRKAIEAELLGMRFFYKDPNDQLPCLEGFCFLISSVYCNNGKSYAGDTGGYLATLKVVLKNNRIITRSIKTSKYGKQYNNWLGSEFDDIFIDYESDIEEAYLLIYGVDYYEMGKDRYAKVNPKAFPPLKANSRLKNPIRVDLSPQAPKCG